MDADRVRQRRSCVAPGLDGLRAGLVPLLAAALPDGLCEHPPSILGNVHCVSGVSSEGIDVQGND